MEYIEDILTELYGKYADRIYVHQRDLLVFSSFSAICARGDALTKSQSNLLLKLMTKYQTQFASAGLDYSGALANPNWKSGFRALDLTKKLYVDKDSSGTTWVMIKFPYKVKPLFEAAFESKTGVGQYSQWDPELKCRKFSLYQANYVGLQQFAAANQFEIDETFTNAMSAYEEILAQQDSIVPACTVVNGKVELINASEDVLQWWEENRKNVLEDDLMLAKAMGYFYNGSPTNMVEKMASVAETNFWVESFADFLKVAKQIDGKTCVILDRANSNFQWICDFTTAAELVGFAKEEIKICFRSEHETGARFNQWVKDRGYGGKVDSGKLLIFNHKPAKWVFKSPDDIKILATNNIYPPTDKVTSDWMSYHSCVVYLGDIKPSKTKDTKIVKL